MNMSDSGKWRHSIIIQHSCYKGRKCDGWDWPMLINYRILIFAASCYRAFSILLSLPLLGEGRNLPLIEWRFEKKSFDCRRSFTKTSSYLFSQNLLPPTVIGSAFRLLVSAGWLLPPTDWKLQRFAAMPLPIKWCQIHPLQWFYSDGI